MLHTLEAKLLGIRNRIVQSHQWASCPGVQADHKVIEFNRTVSAHILRAVLPRECFRAK